MASDEPVYNLKAVIRETGLTPELLRAWERRYGLPKPQRTPGGHRLYSEHDIALLRWLVARQREGFSISRAAELWKSQKSEGQDPLQAELAGFSEIAGGGPSVDELRSRWVNACLNFDEQEANAALSQVLAIASPETACLEVLQKGLSEIGELWYLGQASVQQEHFASSLAMRRLHALVAAAPLPSRTPRILAACPPGEDHEFGLLLCAFLLRWRGWPVVYLGANVPLARLEEAIRSTTPALLLSLAQTLPAAASLRQMSLLLEEEDLPLVYGGLIFNQLPDLKKLIPGHFLGTDFSSITGEIERAVSQPRRQEPVPQTPIEHLSALQRFRARQVLIRTEVAERMEKLGIQGEHLEIADTFMGQHISAALSLGDICFLNHSLEWVERLLQNFGLPASFIPAYVEAFKEAVAVHMDDEREVLLDCLERSSQAE